MKSTSFKLTALPFCITLAFACMQARADDAAMADAQNQTNAAKAPADGSEHKLETISVTADVGKGFTTKTSQVGAFRDQNILDVPLSINVLPRAVMDAQAVTNLYDVLKNTAGVSQAQINDTVSQNLAIRGISIDNRTSYRLNGSLPVNNLIEMPMEDKERVEALKGSSALYYGFTSPAGIINMVTKRARDRPTAAFDITYDDNGQTVGHVDVGRRFGDNNRYGLRVNLASGKLHASADNQDGSRSLVSAAFDWRVTEAITFKLDYENFHKRLVENSAIALLPAVNNTILLPRIPDSSKLISGPWAKSKAGSENVLGRVDWMLSDTWAAIFEWGRAETDRDARSFTSMQKYNINTGAGTLNESIARGQQYVNNNARVELDGRVQTGFLDHEVSFGAMQNLRNQNNPAQQAYSIAQNMYNPILLPAAYYTIKPTYRPQDITDRGAYVFDRVRLGNDWQFLVGARRTKYRNASTGSPLYEVEKTSPSVGAIYKFRENTSIYANYIEGLEETGTAPITAVNSGVVLPPAVSKQKELGVRSEVIDGITASASLFEIERGSAYLNTSNVYVLDGRTHYQGVDLSVNGELTPEWSVYASALFLDAELRKAQNTALIGKTPENTPDTTASLFADYHPEALPGWSFNAGVYYMAKRAVNNLNQAHIPDYALVNAGVRYTTNLFDRKVTLQLNVENLADKSYWSAVGSGYLGYGKPRTLKFTGRVEL
ncbi:MAG: TonB-dependent siderophore receptor [Proteobacteria bacterium]|uniref:TonB-dependent siderophore receptor n=1 Tax=Rudaea sp. TaxID=2136325 RepID=UPI001D4D25DE|nr:TonB-dependent siderophore receptor [Pseudomonadota bacterium]MBS0568907.1 TonB-dependent siderophore receptor [Pseudomonadota bacterium]